MVAARKATVLLDFGARLMIIAPRPGEEVRALARQVGVSLCERPYGGPDDLNEAALVIAAADDADVNARVARDAQGLGLPINAADDPDLCSFFFPALVRRGDLVAGISTSGACPRLAARLRERLERDWPLSLTDDLARLKEERGRLKTEGASQDEVRRRLDLLIHELFAKYP
jgi:siroheme synthase-like protein